jgi:nucleotide-binding universal stress UspA family protein
MRYARALACRFHAELAVIHIASPPYAAYGSEESAARSPANHLLAQALSEASTRLEQFLNGESQAVGVARTVLGGDPARAIVESAHAKGVDLIVMPTHGYGPFRRFLLGSVTAKVLHDADCPVLTGPHLEGAPDGDSIGFRKVLCALDLGPQSRAVLAWGAGIAQAYSADLAVAYVIPTSRAKLGSFYFDSGWRADLAEAAREQIAGLLDGLHVSAEILVQTGDPPVALSDAARSLKADLLVIGRSHDPGVVGRLRVNAYGVIRESPCAVVSI